MIFVTGGAGFIGSNFVLQWMRQKRGAVVNLDKLTYAGNLGNLKELEGNPDHHFVKGDIADGGLVRQLLEKHRPRAILHFAAESHVDRSLHYPEAFVRTNVAGTERLLEEALRYWKQLKGGEQERFRFIQISTDEVFGSLASDAPSSKEEDPFRPNSPYAASKAAADHFVRAAHKSFGLPAITTRAANNFGPRQFPEKLIPLMILNALQEKPLPVYGDGKQVRSWIHVKDHCRALNLVLEKGAVGSCYNIADEMEMQNIAVVKTLCHLLGKEGKIRHIEDRPGHDRRYALDSSKIRQELNWQPEGNFEERLAETVEWYKNNPEWVEETAGNDYKKWIETHYREEA